MASFNKFNCFVENLAEKMHNLGADTLKVFLTNTAPNASTNTAYDGTTGSTGPAEIAAGNGYTAGGNSATISSSSQTSGTYKLVLADPSTWTASGGSIGPFRYAVLYNDTASPKGLIGYWDYSTSITLLAGETFTVDFDPTTGVLTLG
jgi:hypothetical protein